MCEQKHTANWRVNSNWIKFSHKFGEETVIKDTIYKYETQRTWATAIKTIPTANLSFLIFTRGYIFIYRRERGQERNISRLPPMCVPTGNQTPDLLVYRMTWHSNQPGPGTVNTILTSSLLGLFLHTLARFGFCWFWIFKFNVQTCFALKQYWSKEFNNVCQQQGYGTCPLTRSPSLLIWRPGLKKYTSKLMNSNTSNSDQIKCTCQAA